MYQKRNFFDFISFFYTGIYNSTVLLISLTLLITSIITLIQNVDNPYEFQYYCSNGKTFQINDHSIKFSIITSVVVMSVFLTGFIAMFINLKGYLYLNIITVIPWTIFSIFKLPMILSFIWAIVFHEQITTDIGIDLGCNVILISTISLSFLIYLISMLYIHRTIKIEHHPLLDDDAFLDEL